MVVARLRRQAEVGAEKGATKFCNQFFGGVAFIAPALAPKVVGDRTLNSAEYRAVSTAKSAIAVVGWLGFTGWFVGLPTAVAGTAWAMTTGLAAPIVIMAAFCTFTGAVYLALVPMAYRVLLRSQELPVRVRPNPEIWRHVLQLELCNVDVARFKLATSSSQNGLSPSPWSRTCTAIIAIAVGSSQGARPSMNAKRDRNSVASANRPRNSQPVATVTVAKVARPLR
jgi:hypothetical protein